MLGLVDFFGASFIVFIMSIAEMVAVFWIYGACHYVGYYSKQIKSNHAVCLTDTVICFSIAGVNRLCRDTEFMSGRNPGLYWRMCWGIITPAVMITILLYTFITYKPLTYRGYIYPDTAYGMRPHFSLRLLAPTYTQNWIRCNLIPPFFLSFFLLSRLKCSNRMDNISIWTSSVAIMGICCDCQTEG